MTGFGSNSGGVAIASSSKLKLNGSGLSCIILDLQNLLLNGLLFGSKEGLLIELAQPSL